MTKCDRHKQDWYTRQSYRCKKLGQLWIWEGYFTRFTEKCHICDQYYKPYRGYKYIKHDKITKCDKHEILMSL